LKIENLGRLAVMKKLSKSIVNVHDYVLDVLKLKKRGVTIYRFSNGLKFACRNHTADRWIMVENLVFHEYPFLINPKEKNLVIVDIGANIGAFCVDAASTIKGARIYCFEPVKENYALLEKNIKLNNLSKRIVAHRCAISDTRGNFKINVNRKNFGSSSFHKPGIPEVVKTYPLDFFIRKYKIEKIDMLKMDCEGSEYEIMKTISKDTLDKIQFFVLETHDDAKYSVPEFMKYLHTIGYHISLQNHIVIATKRNK
jgi:FkbM family methyltransferase